ncbi:ANTAR domain-containing protein [Streptomyces sp. NPDC048512]|uniref:ANTAR domain-containing protein n=1 Tax=unclassified Streptomyces TaxID=2593676 RepID=UPI0009F04C26|nr:GAF and ANTAR domain-containing protein [Streptomyces sp. M41(2017)]OQQ13813.1 hypothetical protein B0675_26640 [Streptomyces sp. M41(2017)]
MAADGDGTVGALNVYRRPPHAFIATDFRLLRSLASQASRAIAMAERLVISEQLAQQTRSALKSRAAIDQALGMVMGQRRWSAEEAFAILRSASQQRGIPLHDVCTELIANLTGQPATPPQRWRWRFGEGTHAVAWKEASSAVLRVRYSPGTAPAWKRLLRDAVLDLPWR